MRIRLEWRGNTDTEDGIAIYRTETNTFDLHLPSMQRARQLEQALCTVYADGRRKGHREMNKQDENALTEAWHSDTNWLNGKIDEFFKAAQDHAYALGLARGLAESKSAPPAAVPAGYALVPVEPTEAMLNAARLEQAAAVEEPAGSPMPVVEPVGPAQQVQPERMSLWRINHLLAPLELSQKTLESLGFHETYGASRTTHADYLASDFPKICQAISDHALAAATKKATP